MISPRPDSFELWLLIAAAGVVATLVVKPQAHKPNFILMVCMTTLWAVFGLRCDSGSTGRCWQSQCSAEARP